MVFVIMPKLILDKSEVFMKQCNSPFWIPKTLIVVLSTLVISCSPGGNSHEASPVVDSAAQITASADFLRERYGIEIVALRHTASGHMLDFRFRVVDLDKAMPFFRKDMKPHLLDQKSGKSLSVPVPAKLGPMRPTGRNPKLGVTYWMFFGNPGLVQPGDKVTIVIGDYHLENLVVE